MTDQAQAVKQGRGAGTARSESRGGGAGSDRGQMKQEPVPADSNNGFRQLKVEDALAYLEQVKSQFLNLPSVYNQFLDIMKEFKAQTIDTAEVIRRVGVLFEGHSSLILGFNTFLPPGYKIELRGDPNTGCVTGFSGPGGRFCTLNGDDVSNRSHVNAPPQPEIQTVASAHPPPQQQQPQPQPQQQQPPVAPAVDAVQHRAAQTARTTHRSDRQARPPSPPPPPPPQPPQAAMSRADQQQVYGPAPGYSKAGHPLEDERAQPYADITEHAPSGPPQQPQQQPPPPQGASSLALQEYHSKNQAQPNENAAVALAGGFGMPAVAGVAAGKPVEFDQAVTYVNKIKSRFSDNESMYKTFLGILQTYQKEQRSIKEVYGQVAILFREHDDLLNEFSHFLPETSSQPRAGPAPPATESIQPRVKTHPAAIKKQATLEPVAAEPAPQPPAAVPNSKTKEKSGKSGSAGRGKAGKGSTSGVSGGVSKSGSRPRPSGKDKRRGGGNSSAKKTNAEIRPAPPASSTVSGANVVARTPGAELEFFEELKGVLGEDGQQNYSEFIKCLSLFSQEIIGGDELIRLADGLLNSRKPLTEAFRAFLDQSDPNATQSAVNILRTAKATMASTPIPAADVAAVGTNTGAASNMRSADADREKEDVVMAEGDSKPGEAKAKQNPMYKSRPLSEIGREYGSELPESGSYAELPGDLKVQCSGMTEEDRSVLNHTYVSRGDGSKKELINHDRSRPSPTANKRTVTFSLPPTTGKDGSANGGASNAAGSESPSSPRTVRNGLSRNFSFGVEDQRTEVELLISRATSTVAKLEKIEKGEIRSTSSLTALDLHPVELIYQDAAAEVIETLRANPTKTVPTVLARLRQRITGWQSSRKDLEQIWKSRRFSMRNSSNGAPRSWKRSELIDELIGEVRPEVREGGVSGRLRGAENEDILKRKVECELVCEDDNMNLIIDILWFSFEWVAEEMGDRSFADEGVEFIDRIYKVLQRAQQKGIKLYICEYLYEYIRLVAEASVRMRYIVDNDKDGSIGAKMVENVNDVLNGMIDLCKYDRRCERLFGENSSWDTMLGDFTVVMKRLSEVATTIMDRPTVKKLLRMCEESVEEDGGLKGAKERVGGNRLRKALKITKEEEAQLFEIKVTIMQDRKVECEDGSGERVRERDLGLAFGYVSRDSSGQFEKPKNVVIKEKEVKSDKSALYRYISRAKKRSRQHWEADRKVGRQDLKEDGLISYVDDESGELRFENGTEDFFMRRKFRRRLDTRMQTVE